MPLLSHTVLTSATGNYMSFLNLKYESGLLCIRNNKQHGHVLHHTLGVILRKCLYAI